MTEQQKLPLHNLQASLGARFGSFGHWEVPLYFSGVIDEHETVRQKVGLFDISHMGEIFFEGPDARDVLDAIITNQMTKLKIGKALYSPVCNEKGGIVDDVIVYQLADNRYLVIVNASNIEKDYAWFKAHQKGNVTITNRSDDFGLLSLQGPKSLELLRQITEEPVGEMSYYSILSVSSKWKNAWICRTGYTGELGFEILLQKNDLESAYTEMMEKGKSFGIRPIGFGARDTLRLEAAMLLYGQDMDDDTTPLEAGIGRTVFFGKNFVGKEKLLAQKEKGIQKTLIGFEMVGHGLARHGYEVKKNGESIGCVTSGSFSPTLKKNIGLAYVSAKNAEIGNEIQIQIRQNEINAKIVLIPFYKNKGVSK